MSAPEALADFCLACGAVSLAGHRLDVDGAIPVDGDAASFVSALLPRARRRQTERPR